MTTVQSKAEAGQAEASKLLDAEAELEKLQLRKRQLEEQQKQLNQERLETERLEEQALSKERKARTALAKSEEAHAEAQRELEAELPAYTANLIKLLRAQALFYSLQEHPPRSVEEVSLQSVRSGLIVWHCLKEARPVCILTACSRGLHDSWG